MFQQILVDWVCFHSRTMVSGILQNWFMVYSRTGFWCTLELVFSVLQNWFLVYSRTGFWCTLELVFSVLQNWFLVYSRTGVQCTLELVSSVLQNWCLVYSRTGFRFYCTAQQDQLLQLFLYPGTILYVGASFLSQADCNI